MITTGDIFTSGAGPVAGVPAGGTTATGIIYNLWIEVDVADGSLLLDMTLDAGAGTSSYKAHYSDASWITMVGADVGSLTLLTVPEPMTIALLGLGGLFLRRKK